MFHHVLDYLEFGDTKFAKILPKMSAETRSRFYDDLDYYQVPVGGIYSLTFLISLTVESLNNERFGRVKSVFVKRKFVA